MARKDPWNAVERLDDDVLETMARRLENRGLDDRFMAMTADYLEAADIDAAEQVLELGSGTGVVSRWIGARATFSGRVLGTDLSPFLVAKARRLAEEEGLADQVFFETANAGALRFDDSSFDVVIAHTLLSHVDDPSAILAEAARVLRPGGRVGVFDGDYASVTFEEEDPEDAQRNSALRVQALFTQPRVMRRLPRLARDAGLRVARVFPYLIADVGEANYWACSIQSWRKLGPASGMVSAEEAEAWSDRQQSYSDAGVFFASSAFYGYVLEKEGA